MENRWTPVTQGWEVAVPAGVELGERPVWDDHDQSVVWVDIPTGQIRRYSPSTGIDALWHAAEGTVGCVAVRQGGGVVAGNDRQVLLIDETGQVEDRFLVPGAEDAVFNDGAVDPAGRFVAGTSTAGTRGNGGALYSFSGDGTVRCLVDGVTESNGVAWSPDGATMYYVDSGETYFSTVGQTRVRRYAYDVAAGTAEPLADLTVVPESDGIPDGLVVDVEGAVWLAVWGTGEVRRYAPDGQLLDRLRVPASQPTCPGFGGPDRADLYVTSAHQMLSDEALAAEPMAGHVFVCRPGVAGLAVPHFAD